MEIKFIKSYGLFNKGVVVNPDYAYAKRLIDLGVAERIEYKTKHMETINGIKYLLVSYPVKEKEDGKKLAASIIKYECILKEAEVKGFWLNRYVQLHILVPEHNIIEFNNNSHKDI